VTLLAAVIAGAWVAGCALLLCLMAFPSLRPRVNELWPLMASEALIVAVGVGMWFLPSLVLAAVLIVGALRIGCESGFVHSRIIKQTFTWPYALAIGFVAGLCFFLPLPSWFLAFGVVGAIINLAMNSSAEWAKWLRILCYPVLPAAAFAAAASAPSDLFIVLLAFLFVELFDSFSVLGGRLFGRNKLAPILSPKKTWEGLAFGLAVTLASATALAPLFDMPIMSLAAIAIVTVIAALLGDLAASAAKRRAGVKDYPGVLPVQGGLLDIVDAWIVAGPTAVLIAKLLTL
jgi:phosphatidate cytidylyltransferase